jgi:protein-glutamine gamma-glutamyltransferase
MGLEIAQPRPAPSVRYMAFALMAIATLAVELACLTPGESPWAGAGMAAALSATTVLLTRLAPAPAAGAFHLPLRFTIVLTGLVLFPFLLEPMREHFGAEGRPLEVRMLAGFRNLGLGLAALAAWPVCLRLACLVSLFLMLFAVILADHWRVLPLLGVYGVAGVAWLSLAYWERLRVPETAGAGGAVRLPWGMVTAASLLVAAVLALASVGPERAAAALAELLPTSGGTGENDPRSRGGVNDGDEETIGQNPRSTGFAETDQFLDSPLPSLYDMFSDMYGKPYKRQEIEQAIALGADVRVRDLPKPPPDNLRPSRDFATARHAPQQPRDPSARSARALFEVDGPTPLHVRVVAYDFYDGVSWYEAKTYAAVGFSAREPGDTWMTVMESPRPFYHGKVEHRFRIARLDGSLVPIPPYLERLRLGRVDREDFFAWSQERILRLAHRKIPGGVTVETVAHTVHPRLLRELMLRPEDLFSTRGPLQTLGREDVAALARRWVEGIPFGWRQVETVVERLREEYMLDPAARGPAGCADTTRYFLLESKRGPDYEFASAAALVLRHLGYPTRLVSGYYAAPDHYDAQSGHTPVTADDAHFWTEVMLPGRIWVVIEPTPGYEIMGPALPFSERLAAFFARIGNWCAEHTVGLSFSVVMFIGLAVWRRYWLDMLGLLRWRIRPGRSWREWVLRSAHLVERRCRWAGGPRPPGLTPTRWLGASVADSTPERDTLLRLTQLAEWAAYSPRGEPPAPRGEVWATCHAALRTWTLPRFRRATLAMKKDIGGITP